jgi:hypothetical protein
MNLYFGSTSERFLYGHYLAVASALKTQQVDSVVMVCTMIPDSQYFELIRNKVVVTMFTVADFPMLGNVAEQQRVQPFVAAISKDYIEWTTLLAYGGIFMDLDTLSIKNMSNLLGNYDVIASPDQIAGLPVYEAAIVIAKKNSTVIKDTLSFAMQAFSNRRGKYTMTGPAAYTKAILRHMNLVGWPGYDSLGPRIQRARPGKQAYIPAWTNADLPVNTYALHLYASSTPFNLIDKDFVADSDSMYAKTVRQVLSRDEWYR